MLETTNSKLEFYAHRGYHTHASLDDSSEDLPPENTLEALKLAWDHPWADGLELDTQPIREKSKKSKLVAGMFHDPLLNRLCGESVRGADRSNKFSKSIYRKIQNAIHFAGKNYKIPLLKDFVSFAKLKWKSESENKKKVLVELKEDGYELSTKRIQEHCAKVAADLAKLPENCELIIHSFGIQTMKHIIKECEKRKVKAKFAFLFEDNLKTITRLFEENKFIAKKLDYLHPQYPLLLDLDSRKQILDLCKKLGTSLNTWTVNKVEELTKLLDIEELKPLLKGVITDNLNIAKYPWES